VEGGGSRRGAGLGGGRRQRPALRGLDGGTAGRKETPTIWMEKRKWGEKSERGEEQETKTKRRWRGSREQRAFIPAQSGEGHAMPDWAGLNRKGQCTGNAKTAKTTRRQCQWLEGDAQGDPQDTLHGSRIPRSPNSCSRKLHLQVSVPSSMLSDGGRAPLNRLTAWRCASAMVGQEQLWLS